MIYHHFAFGGFGCDAEARVEVIRRGAERGAEHLNVALRGVSRGGHRDTSAGRRGGAGDRCGIDRGPDRLVYTRSSAREWRDLRFWRFLATRRAGSAARSRCTPLVVLTATRELGFDARGSRASARSRSSFARSRSSFGALTLFMCALTLFICALALFICALALCICAADQAVEPVAQEDSTGVGKRSRPSGSRARRSVRPEDGVLLYAHQ